MAEPKEVTGWSRRELGWFCLVLALLLLVFFGESLVFGKLLSPADLLQTSPVFLANDAPEPRHRLLTDAVYAFTPWRKIGFEALRRGRVPRLNVDNYCGAPFAQNFQAARFYPLRLIPAHVSPRANAFFHALELFLAGLGIYILAVQLGLRSPSRWLGGLAWAFSGFLVVGKLWPTSSAAFTLPWILLGLVLLLRGSQRSGIVVTTVSVSLSWLGGHPQTTTQILSVVGMYGLYQVVVDRDQRKERAVSLARWAAAVTLGTGVVAFFILPGLNYLLASHAWGVRVEGLSPWQLTKPNLQSLPGFFLPFIWGSRLAGSLPLDSLVGAYNTNELAGGYVSFLLPLVILPIAFWRRKEIPEFHFWAGCFLFCLCLGVNLPVVSNLIQSIPVFGASKPVRMILFSGLATIMLAMKVLHSLRSSPLTRREARRLRVLLLVIGLGALTAAGSFRLLRPTIQIEVERRLPGWSPRLADNPVLKNVTPEELTLRLEKTTVWYPLWIGTITLLAVVALAAASGRGRYREAPLIGLVVLDLFAFGRNYTPAIDAESHFPTSPPIRFLQQSLGSYRVAAAGKVLPPNVLSYYGLPDIRGLDAIESREYMELCIKLFRMEDAQPENFKFYAHTDYTHPIVDFLGLKYLVTDRPLEVLVEDEFRRQRFRLEFESGSNDSSVFIYENQDVLLGYYLARTLTVEEDSDARLQRLENWNTAERPAVVETGLPRTFGNDSTVTKVRADDGTYVFAGHFTTDSFLVVAATYYTGSTCFIDGRETPVIRTNHAFQGVHVPAGANEVVFTYRVPWLRTGGIISLISLFVLAAWLVYKSKRRSELV